MGGCDDKRAQLEVDSHWCGRKWSCPSRGASPRHQHARQKTEPCETQVMGVKWEERTELAMDRKTVDEHVEAAIPCRREEPPW